jgi:hypothetical protein
VLDDFVLFLLDHLVFHADDFIVGLLKLSWERSFTKWTHLNFTSISFCEFGVGNECTVATINTFLPSIK